ncbi:MAG: glycine C-acetyltransferase, partial [Candidatus Coatesbacteria bacterium]|nr:glycine C-acetyltransferase [Candidatus Coatesbacteria bacterium]
MFTEDFQRILEKRIEETRERGLYKDERIIVSRQGARIGVADSP